MKKINKRYLFSNKKELLVFYFSPNSSFAFTFSPTFKKKKKNFPFSIFPSSDEILKGAIFTGQSALKDGKVK